MLIFFFCVGNLFPFGIILFFWHRKWAYGEGLWRLSKGQKLRHLYRDITFGVYENGLFQNCDPLLKETNLILQIWQIFLL